MSVDQTSTGREATGSESNWRAASPSRVASFTGRRFLPHRWFISIAKLATRGGTYNVFNALSFNRRAFRPFIAYNSRLMPFGYLDRRTTELAILRVAWLCGSSYEWGQHAPIGRKAGLSDDELEAIKSGPASDSWNARDRTLLTACDELVEQHVIADDTWESLRALLNDAELVELCLLVGHYAGLAGALNSLGVELEPRWRKVS